MRPKISEINLLRAVSIIAVLVIHATANGTVELAPGSLSQMVYLGVNKFSNFAVPVFIFISGLVLFYRYYDVWSPREMGAFYKKRIKFILVPYLLWSLFYYFYYQLISYKEVRFHLGDFAKLLPWGDASYHLYFISIIAQFYLLFPILMALAKRFHWFKNGLFPIGIAVQCATYGYHYFVEPIAHRATLCFTYFSVFALGAFIGIHFDQFRSWINRHRWWVLPSCILAGIGFSGMFLLLEAGISFKGVWYDALFFLYAMLVGMSLIWLGEKLKNSFPSIRNMIVSLGSASFLIYLMHPTILSALRVLIGAPGNIWGYHAFTAVCLLLIGIIPWVAFIVLKPWKYAWIIIGK